MVKCICLSEEYIGADSAAICHKHIGRKKGYVCPRTNDPWVVHASCFNLTQLLRLTQARVMELLHPATTAIFGDGEPDSKPVGVSATGITEVFGNE